MKYRRFGRTDFQIPVISCGGMRYQESWKDDDPVSDKSQKNLEACIRKALDLGINHIETARGYGTSEYQLGKILPELPRDEIFVQSKVEPSTDVEKFKDTFEKSMSLLNMDYLDIFSFHGINTNKTLEAALACMDTVEQWKKEGRIRDIGFSTHGLSDIIIKAIRTGHFDHINLHYYYIWQENWPAIEEAQKLDVGVFIISPNDKGGLLYKPSEKLVELCAPLHPMVFNGLFCLSHPEIHTLSCGVSCPEDFDIHIQTVEMLDQAHELLPPIMDRLEREMEKVMGEEWARHWQDNLPIWKETPDNMNLQWILRLRNLALAYDMVEYGKMRYNLLGSGGHWFPGQQVKDLTNIDLAPALVGSTFANEIPAALQEAHDMFKGEDKKRLQED
ncbi:MAG: aldo/keto reductase [Candidatus Hydrogenedentota bacterium]|nr:MAG: aldo/keto reductase [Candidatus Hydrogenedentota bacterium]